jgi:transcription-repair coupling factor (superfamily II helicase)
VAIKALCRRANVERVEAGPKGAVIAFRDGTFRNPDGLIAWIADPRSEARVRPDQTMVVHRDWATVDERMRGTRELLQRLVEIAERARAA